MKARTLCQVLYRKDDVGFKSLLLFYFNLFVKIFAIETQNGSLFSRKLSDKRLVLLLARNNFPKGVNDCLFFVSFGFIQG